MKNASNHRESLGALKRALPFIAPWLFGFFTLTLYPFAASLYWSFCRFDLLGSPEWIGGENYARLANELWSHGPFGRAIWNTAYYTALSVPLSIIMGICLALLLSQKVRGVSLCRTLWFLPSVVPTVAMAILWMGLLDPNGGLVNQVLIEQLGLEGQGWLNSTSEAAWPPAWPVPFEGRLFGSKDALVLMALWGVGNFMVIYLAALGDIPTSLQEAAKLDGAGPVRRLFFITLPMLSPVIFFNLVMSIIQSMQAFTQVYLVSDGQGDPASSTLLLSLHLFLAAFRDLEIGYASAMAWGMFTLVLMVTWWLFRTSKRWVYYQQ